MWLSPSLCPLEAADTATPPSPSYRSPIFGLFVCLFSSIFCEQGFVSPLSSKKLSSPLGKLGGYWWRIERIQKEGGRRVDRIQIIFVSYILDIYRLQVTSIQKTEKRCERGDRFTGKSLSLSPMTTKLTAHFQHRYRANENWE